MRFLSGIAMTLVLSGTPLLGFGGPTRTPTRPRSHGYSLAGVVVRVDAKAKTFAVRSGAGTETTLVRTGATHVQGELKAGDRVAVRFLEKDGKKIATSVRIESTVVSVVTPTASAGTR